MISSTKEASALERRLSAYIDGQASDAEKQELESLLVNDPQARSLYDQLKRGGEIGRRLFDDMLKEPVPLHVVRDIKNAPLPRKAVRLPYPPRPSLAFRPTGPQLLGACLLMLFLGGGIGYLAGTQPAPPLSAASLSNSDLQVRDWLDDIISHYRLYTRQDDRLVELAADQPADILQWLTTGTGVTFRIPDLTASGLTFVGARLVSADNMPTGMLLYRRDAGDGDVLALTFSRTRPEISKPVEDIRIDTGLVSWSSALATYVLVGPSAAADLDEIAAKAAGLI